MQVCVGWAGQLVRSGVDRASSSDARGPGFEPRPLRLKKPLLYPETLEVPIRGRVQLRILELGDEAWEKQKKYHHSHLNMNYVKEFKFTVGFCSYVFVSFLGERCEVA